MRKTLLLISAILLPGFLDKLWSSTISQDSMPAHYLLMDSIGINFNLERNLLTLTQTELQNPSLPCGTDPFCIAIILAPGVWHAAFYEDDKNIMYPIEDMTHVDQLRKSVGLGPLKEYMEEAKINFK